MKSTVTYGNPVHLLGSTRSKLFASIPSQGFCEKKSRWNASFCLWKGYCRKNKLSSTRI